MKAKYRKAFIRDLVMEAVATFVAWLSRMRKSCPKDRPVLVFADGTFESNALMVESVAYEIGRRKAVVWAYEYGPSHSERLQKGVGSGGHVVQCNIQEWFLIRIFSLYRRSIWRPVSFAVYIILLSRWFYSLSPSILVLANDIMFSSRFLAFLARARGIPSVALQHGTVGPAHFPMVADRFGVYSEAVRDYVVACGWLELDRIIVVGNPRWDLLVGTKDRLSTTRNILVLSQASAIEVLGTRDPNIEALFSLIESLAIKYGDRTFTIRLHPLEDGRHWRDLEQSLANVHIQKSVNVELAAALRSSDFVISGSSTGFYEAAIMGLPCISYRPYANSAVVLPVTEMDSFLLIARAEGEVVDLIEQFYRDPQSFPRLNNRPVANMGSATAGVAAYVLNSLKEVENLSDRSPAKSDQ
ncbi:MAG: hypothetical protein F9K24_07365 [Leptonema illini]|jgi:hypothetical protein|uniref:UDP-N-acetylglucosamine 2-epimerase domain-containing protein n=1 Tax=Leptonema illini TaxID=183 RepID=A0A833LXV5_9LEPT|nr:MAG: hypothetical protein F9K24_07365 [Leptonema illini]